MRDTRVLGMVRLKQATTTVRIDVGDRSHGAEEEAANCWIIHETPTDAYNPLSCCTRLVRGFGRHIGLSFQYGVLLIPRPN